MLRLFKQTSDVKNNSRGYIVGCREHQPSFLPPFIPVPRFFSTVDLTICEFTKWQTVRKMVARVLPRLSLIIRDLLYIRYDTSFVARDYSRVYFGVVYEMLAC